jgi:hypothetical protein
VNRRRSLGQERFEWQAQQGQNARAITGALFYELVEPDKLAVLEQMRTFMQTKVVPIINALSCRSSKVAAHVHLRCNAKNTSIYRGHENLFGTILSTLNKRNWL